MDRDTESLKAERLELVDKLGSLGSGARIRPAAAFHAIDEASFYAEDSCRELRVFVAEDVAWGPDISHYIEEPDGLRSLRRMTIDVPNELNGHVSTIQQLFTEWFGIKERL